MAIMRIGVAAAAAAWLIAAAGAADASAVAPATRTQADALAASAARIDIDAEPARAQAAWRTVVSATEQAYGPRSRQMVRALMGLADALDNVGPDGVIEAASKALAIEEGLATPDEAVLAEILEDLGAAYGIKFELEKAQPLLTRAHDLATKLYGPDDPRVARALAQLGWTKVRMGEVPVGLPMLERAVQIDRAKLKPSDRQRINAELLYGGALSTNDENLKAEIVFREALQDTLTLGPDDNRRAMVQAAMAYVLVKLGRSDEAGELFSQAVALRRRIGPPADLADALAGVGFVRLDQDRPEEAEALFMECQQANIQANNPVMAAVALMNAGTAAARKGDQQTALARRKAALATLQSQPQPNPVAVGLSKYKLADSYAATGDLKMALEMETDAAATIRKIRVESHPQRLGVEINLGLITALSGDPQAGIALARPAALRMEAESRKLEVAQVKTTGVKENAETFGRALRTAELAQDLESGFHFAQVLIETDAGRAAAAENARAVAGAGPLADALKRRQTLAARKVQLDDAFLAANADAAKSGELKVQIAAVQAEVTRAEAVLDQAFPNYRALTDPAPITVAEAQAKLDPGEALIVPVATDDGLFVFALTRTAVAWDRSPITRREVRGLVRRMRASIDAGAGVRAAVDASGGSQTHAAAFDRKAAFELYSAIFTDKIRALTDRAKLYTLASSDAFSAAPFAMLVTAPPQGSDSDPAALRATPWLIRKAAIQVAPSIPAMRVGTEPLARNSGFFGAGAPALTGAQAPGKATTYFRSAGVDVTAVRGLAALPGADAELRSMSRALGADRSQLLIGNEATEAAVKGADLGQARIVAFATHGLVAGELTGLAEPALVFTPPAEATTLDDALLTASEAAQLKLNADWVILSACNTAAGETGQSPGYTGLARAFMLAGGRRVLASHWPVRDDAAARLTVDTVRLSARGETPARALQKAMLKLIDDRTVPGGSDPSVWAPFVLVGR